MRALTLILLLWAAVAHSQIVPQNLVAILASGNISDFGYSYTVNAGRVKMERNLNITGSRYIPNIEDMATAFTTIQGLVAEGFHLIITTTSLHGNASAMAASQYPNVSFVHVSGQPYLPNLSILSFSGPDMYYAAGTFCGAMTKNNRVGFVHPNAPVASFATLNAFYVGVKESNPNAEVYVVYTNTYLDPDRTRGACNILLNSTFVDQIAGQQDDMTLQEAAMENGLLAVGISGYPMREIYGESVGMSVLKDWGSPFTVIAQGVINATNFGTVFGGKSISAAFKSGWTTLDTPSYLVSDEAWAKVRAAAVNLTKPIKPYYCSPWVSYLGVSNTTGCLTNTTTFSAAPITAIIDRGTFIVPLEEVPFPKGTAVALIVLAAILWLGACCISAALYYLRRDTVMLASSPLFLALVLFGCAMTFSSVIAWVADPSKSACTARIWLPSIGCTLCMGAMIIKNVRLWLIFDAAMRKIKIRDLRLLAWTGVLLTADVLLLALWTGLGDPRVNIEQGKDGLSTYEIRKTCVTSLIGDKLLYAIVSLHIAQLAVGCFVTFKIRVIDIEEFNESRPFGLCIYIVSLVFTICGILIGTSGTTNVQIIIMVSLSLLISSGAVLFVLFMPKFLTIFVKGNRPIERIINSMRTKGSSSTASATQSSNPMPSNKSVQLQEI